MTGERSSAGGAKQGYANLRFGGHVYHINRLIVGAMIQFNSSDETLRVGTFTGQGWLTGLYLLGRVGYTSLIYSASPLHGQSSSTLTLTGFSRGDFSSTRTLAMLGL